MGGVRVEFGRNVFAAQAQKKWKWGGGRGPFHISYWEADIKV